VWRRSGDDEDIGGSGWLAQNLSHRCFLGWGGGVRIIFGGFESRFRDGDSDSDRSQGDEDDII
jgi:hypothetical protein